MAKSIQLKNSNNEKIYPNTVIEKNLNNGETSIKYSDGTMVCYGSKSVTYSINDMWSWCDRTALLTIDFSKTFKDVPSVTISSNTFEVIGVNVSSVSTSNFKFYGFQPKNCGQRTIKLSYIAIGKWK